MGGRKKKGRGGARVGSGRKAKSPTGEARTEPIPVNVTPAELDQLREFAAARGRSLADFVRGELGLVNLSEQNRQSKDGE